MFAITGCASENKNAVDLETSKEVLVKGDGYANKITDADRISSLAGILNQRKEIEPPEKAKGIKLDVAKETVLIHFL